MLYTMAFAMMLIMQCHAQSKPFFSSLNYLGIMEGNAGTYLGIQSINGFQHKTWFAGVGTGIDYYYFRSIPLFLAVNKDLCSCQRTFYFSLEGGVNWIWEKETRSVVNNFQNGDFDPSLYWSGGIGYRIGLKNNRDAVLLNLGYSGKHLTQEFVNTMVCPAAPCPFFTEKVYYHFNRFFVRAGWRFR